MSRQALPFASLAGLLALLPCCGGSVADPDLPMDGGAVLAPLDASAAGSAGAPAVSMDAGTSPDASFVPGASGGGSAGSGGSSGGAGSSGSAGSGGTPAMDAGTSPDASTSPPLKPLTPSSDGGGLALSCAPSDGDGQTPTVALGCTFVDEAACMADSDCAAGCACQCGVCNCNAPDLPSSCTSAADCGPSSLGLSCFGGACVSTQPTEWTGLWTGTFNYPSTLYGGSCDQGTGPASATGTVSGSYTIQIVGQGDQLQFLLLSQQGSGEPLCALPFVVSGNSATLVPGSACVTLGESNQCSDATIPSPAIQTFLSGSATLSNGTLSMQLADVFVTPTQPGPECQDVPAGLVQVNLESMTATLTRSASGG